MKLTFLGAAGTVTGSKYLLENKGDKLLIDAGLFQGQRNWREMNWNPPPFNPSEIGRVLVTHAHIDHTGMLPRFHKLGLKCPIFMTAPSAALVRLLLPDSGRLQEEEAEYRAERHKSRHSPPLPLYTEDDAVSSLELIEEVHFDKEYEVASGISAAWQRAGHILGAASITLKSSDKAINFSGDIGRYSVPLLVDPVGVKYGNLLLIESTYGDRLHDDQDPKVALAEIISRTAKRGGVTVIPAFAVGRCQLLLYYLRELKHDGQIPDIPVIIDSPMALDATSIYASFPSECDARLAKYIHSGKNPFSFSKTYFIRQRAESIKLNSLDEPMVIISASGMLSGGRVLHHLKHRIADPRNTILFVGFQPPGSRGDWIKSGARSLRLLGDEIPINAEIAEISSLSAHGDRDELLRWCRSGTGRPDKVAVVHGEPESAESFAETLRKELKWDVFVPQHGQSINL